MNSDVLASYPAGLTELCFPERRREPRFEVAEPATVTQLIGSPERVPAIVLDISAQGMNLKLARSLPISAPIQIDVQSDMILGEVRYCILEENGSYSVGVEIDQILRNVSEVFRSWAEAR